jgi:hypothetical protein
MMGSPRTKYVVVALGLILCALPVWAQTPWLSKTARMVVRPPVLERVNPCGTTTWVGGVNGRFSDARKWEFGIAPSPCSVVRFDGRSGDAVIDPASGGAVAGLIMEEDFRGTLRLARNLVVNGELHVAGGKLEQDRFSVATVDLTQTGGTYEGGDDRLWIEDAAVVGGGLLITPHDLMRVNTLEIRGPGVVRVGANGKLEIAGEGEPLVGDGLLDTTTNRPTSVEYSGRATSDITAAGPARAFHSLTLTSHERDTLLRSRPEHVDQAISSNGGQRTFGWSGAIQLKPDEEFPSCAVIDPDRGFAYFASETDPGIVVKIDLRTFTRVGVLILDAKEMRPGSAVIDPVNGFAYFGAGDVSSPYGKTYVVKINLATFTREAALTLESGNDNSSVPSAVIDVAHGFAYFGAATTPGKIVKVDLARFTPAGTLTLNSGENFPSSAVIDTAHGFAYFGTGGDSGIVVKVDLATFSRVGALTLDAGEKSLNTGVIDAVRGYAYFGTVTIPGKVVKVDLTTFKRAGALTLDSGENYPRSAVIDTDRGFAYFGTASGSYSNPRDNYVVKIDLASFTRTGVLALAQGEHHWGDEQLLSAVIDPTSGFAYFGVVRNVHSWGGVAKVNLATFKEDRVLDLIPGENHAETAVIDPANRFAYFGTSTDPGIVVKINLATFTRVGALVLGPGEGPLWSSVIDAGRGFAYFGTGSNPARIVKVNLATFTRVGATTLNTGENELLSAVIDTDHGFAYFGTSAKPGIVVKVDLATLARVSALALNAGEASLWSAVIDSNRGFAYFGTGTEPGIAVKVNLSTFARVGALALASGEDNLYSAVIDPAAGFAYFGSHAGVVKIDLATFTRVGALILGGDLTSAMIDPANGFACFAMNTHPSSVYKVNLNPSTVAGEVDLGMGSVWTGVMDPANGYAYFSGQDSSDLAVIAKIDLGYNIAPTAGFTWSPTNPTKGQPVQITDTSAGSPTSWSWSFGDSSTSTDQNPVHTFANPGTYTVRLQVSNASGTSTTSNQITVGLSGHRRRIAPHA